MQDSSMPAERPLLGRMLAIYLVRGNFTFGGGMPTVAALQSDLAERRGWLRPADIAMCFAVSRLTPGTNLLAFCTATAYVVRGLRAAVLALAVASLPSALVAMAVTRWYVAAVGPLARAAVQGAGAAAIGLMVAAAWQLIRPAQAGRRWVAWAIVAGAFLLNAGLGWPPIPVLALAAGLGFATMPVRS